MTRRWMWAGLAAVTALAAFLRFYKLDVLPPGLFGDEALVSLHAREAVASGHYPIYFAQSDGGFHPGVVYATMLARWLTGGHPYAVRFAMATAGLLTIPLAFFAFRALFALDHSEQRAEIAGLLAAFILSITFPYLLINRVGFEITLAPLAVVLVLWPLALALHTGRRLHFALAGAALGLSLYAYYPLRFMPLAVVAVFVWTAAAGGWKDWKERILQLGIITVCAVVVFAPLGLFFLQNPVVFFARAAFVSEQTLGEGGLPILARLFHAAWRTVASISIDGFGDFIARHNLPYRAVFDPVLSLLFWAGLVLSILHPRRGSSAILFPVLAFMLIPVIVTFNENTPHFTRMSSAMPAFAGFAALGLLALFDLLAQRSHRLAVSTAFLGLALSLFATSYDYFVRYANHPALFDAFQVADWRVITTVLAELPGTDIYLSPNILTDPAHASMLFMLKDTAARQFPGPGCLVYRDRPARPMLYIVDALHDKGTFDRVHALYPDGKEGATILHNVGAWPIYQFFDVPALARPRPPATAAGADFGDALRLVGYDIDRLDAKAGEAVTLTLHWQALRSLDIDYAIFVHLYSPGGDEALLPPIAQSDGFPCGGQYQTSILEAGEIVVDQRIITIPADAPSGKLPLAAGAYEWTTVQRLPVAGSGAILPDNRLRLTELTVTP